MRRDLPEEHLRQEVTVTLPLSVVLRIAGNEETPRALIAGRIPEQAWMDAITELGCIVCRLFEDAPGTPGEVHHLKRGGRRIGHLASICLCAPGHHRQSTTPRKISRHPDQAAFERAYGTEAELLAQTRVLVARMGQAVDIDRIHHVRGAVRNA